MTTRDRNCLHRRHIRETRLVNGFRTQLDYSKWARRFYREAGRRMASTAAPSLAAECAVQRKLNRKYRSVPNRDRNCLHRRHIREPRLANGFRTQLDYSKWARRFYREGGRRMASTAAPSLAAECAVQRKLNRKYRSVPNRDTGHRSAQTGNQDARNKRHSRRRTIAARTNRH